MKRPFGFLIMMMAVLVFSSCVSVPTRGERELELGEYTISESSYGGTECWYAVDKYNYDTLIDKIRFQVGYFKESLLGLPPIAFILYGDGTVGEEAYFQRQGLDLRWDWGSYERNGEKKYRYAFVIEPDGTGLYYDFSTSTDGIAEPRGIYKVRKF